jgi:hypothetical protein
MRSNARPPTYTGAVRGIIVVGLLSGLSACTFDVSGLGPGAMPGDDLGLPAAPDDLGPPPPDDLARPGDGPAVQLDLAAPPDLRPAGFLSVNSVASDDDVDLTSIGKTDWIHWATDPPISTDRKAAGGSQIGNFATLTGSSLLNRSTSSPIKFTWSDGAAPHPTQGGTNTSTYLTSGGYSITAPADKTRRRLLFYVGLEHSQCQMHITLSDGSAAAYQDTKWQSSDDDALAVVYTIDYSAAGPGQTLNVSWSMVKSLGDGPIVGIGAAALTPPP